MGIEEYVEHMPPLVPPDEAQAMSRYFLDRCPVVHSDHDGGFWVVNRHDHLLQIMQDWEGFANGNRGVRIPHDPPGLDRPPMPPLDSNPPLHRDVRRLLNPFLSPQALEAEEPMFRSVISALIDDFVADGYCDIAWQLAKNFPADTTTRFLFRITDSDELERLRHWVRRLSYDMLREDPEILQGIQVEWSQWCQELVDDRRANPGDDIVTAMIEATVEGGRRLSDLELIGAIQILILGGFSTTSDATSNVVIRLIEQPELQEILRNDPSLIPAAIEEAMRLEPPIDTRPRRCTRDTQVGDRVIRANDRVLCNYLAANVDPHEWEDPDEFKLDRTRNRIMTFGAGPHRCIGSNMARMSLRIMVEELLARVENIRWDGDSREERIAFNPGAWRAVDALPIRFDPRPVSV